MCQIRSRCRDLEMDEPQRPGSAPTKKGRQSIRPSPLRDPLAIRYSVLGIPTLLSSPWRKSLLAPNARVSVRASLAPRAVRFGGHLSCRSLLGCEHYRSAIPRGRAENPLFGGGKTAARRSVSKSAWRHEGRSRERASKLAAQATDVKTSRRPTTRRWVGDPTAMH